jgi:hypothetical protein
LQSRINSLSLGTGEATPISDSFWQLFAFFVFREFVVAQTLANVKRSSAFGMKKLRGTGCPCESIRACMLEFALHFIFCSLGVLRL